MKILFDPSAVERGTGVSSFLSFQNEDFVDILHKKFGVRKNEELEQIEICKDGITGRFRSKA
jgi:hypothetical protein